MAVGTLPSSGVDYEVGTAASAARSRVWSKLSRNPAAIAGTLVLLVVIVAAVGAHWLAPHDPAKQSLLRRFTPPVWQAGGSAAYVLGTDQVGRDILSRMIYGARISLLVGALA